MANPALLDRTAAQGIWPGAVVVERGANHIVHRHPTEPNRFMLDSHVGRIHHPDNLTEIDDDMQVDGADGFTLKTYQTPYLFRVGDTGIRRLYPDRNNLNAYIEFDRPTNLGAVTSKGRNFIFWDRANFSVKVETQTMAVKLTIVMKNANAFGVNPVKTISFPYTATGLTRTGRILYASGMPVAELRAPTALDAQGEAVPVSFSINGTAATMTIDTTGFAASRFPIEIDPTLDLQVGAGVDDGHIWSGNLGWSDSAPQITAGQRATNTYYDLCAKFSISGLGGATITASYFSLYGDGNVGTGGTKTVYAEDVAAPTAITSYADHQGRTRTTNGVNWDGTLTVGAFNNSPSINTVLQELVDSYGAGISGIRILYDHRGVAGGSNNWASAVPYDGSSTNAPKLHMEYTVPGVTLTAALSFAGLAVKRNNQTETAALSFAGNTVKQVQKAITGIVSFGSTLATYTSKVLLGTLSFVGAVRFVGALLSITLDAALSFTGALFKQTTFLATSTISFGGNITKRVGKLLTGVLSWAGAWAKWITRLGVPTVALSSAQVGTLALSTASVNTLSITNASVATLSVSSGAYTP